MNCLIYAELSGSKLTEVLSFMLLMRSFSKIIPKTNWEKMVFEVHLFRTLNISCMHCALYQQEHYGNLITLTDNIIVVHHVIHVCTIQSLPGNKLVIFPELSWLAKKKKLLSGLNAAQMKWNDIREIMDVGSWI